jgi:cell division protein FtsI/penicillin-binding protein 2
MNLLWLTIAAVLAERFPHPDITYVLMSVAEAQVVASRWPDLEKPVPAGSLLKPFTALGYGDAHAFRYPRIRCTGDCWKPGGHGDMDLAPALAFSCNRYFRELTGGVVHNEDAPPIDVIRAYCSLKDRLPGPGGAAIARGLRMAAAQGTAKDLRMPALAKTGTAPCTHDPRGEGDGFTIVLFPPEKPVYALLVGVHGTTGARAAGRAGEMVRAIQGVR